MTCLSAYMYQQITRMYSLQNEKALMMGGGGGGLRYCKAHITSAKSLSAEVQGPLIC